MNTKKLFIVALGLGILASFAATYIDLEIFRDYGLYKDYYDRGIIKSHPSLERQFSNSPLKSVIDAAYDNRPDEDVWYPFVYGVLGIILLLQFRKYYLLNKENKGKNVLIFFSVVVLALLGWILGLILLFSTGLIVFHCC